MDILFKPSSEWPVYGEYDVAVFGAGPSGLGAAITAARLGMKTILVEKYGFPGGNAALVCTPFFMGFAVDGQQIVGGLAEEIVRLTDHMGAASFVTQAVPIPEYRPIGDRPLTQNVLMTSESLRIVFNRLLQQAGVNRLFYTMMIGAVVEQRKMIAAAIAATEEPALIKAKCFIDATGDAHLVHLAGGHTRDYSVTDSMHKSMFFEAGGITAHDVGENKLRYKRLFECGKVPQGLLNYYAVLDKLEPGMAQVCFTKAIGSALNSAELTRMDAEMREQIPIIMDFLRREMPGFEQAFVVNSSIHVGIRAGRGIVGLETLTQQQIDSQIPVSEPIALIGRTYGSHSVQTEFLPEWRKSHAGISAVPLKSLLSPDYDNVIAGGRSISLEPRIIDTIRLMPRCMTIGQAAGVTALLAIQNHQPVEDVPYGQVQEKLLAAGVILDGSF